MKRWFLRLLLPGVFGMTALGMEHPVLLSQAIDFLDNAYFTERGDYYSKEELAERLRLARDAGIRKIYFRGTGGVSYYPSRVRRMFAGEHRYNWGPKLVKTIHSYDVVAEYIKVCHELGMELYYWDPVFDTSLYAHYFPGTRNNELYGEWPFRDMSIREEHYTAHRFASRPRGELRAPISRLELHTVNVPAITAENLVIYTAPHDQHFQRYQQPFSVEVTPEGKGARVTISGLNITEPVIKLMGADENAFAALSDPRNGDCARAFYADGEPVELFTTCEFIIDGDDEPEKNLRGSSGYGYYWGNHRVPLFIRFGDFERYAIGVPEYAYPENRERMKAIVTELYERYPDLDGVTFSIRSHSLPSGGSYEAVGGHLFYGFSEPIVDEYRKRYGTDITCEAYDENKLLKLRGEYFTEMLREVAEIVHAHGGKLECMAPVRVPVGAAGHGSMYPWWQRTNIDNFFDIETWAKKGIVDNVIMLGTDHQQQLWSDEWKREVKAFHDKLAGTGTRLTLHYLINGARESDIDALLPEVLKTPELDEVEFYEEHDMFATGDYPRLTEAIKRSGREIVK